MFDTLSERLQSALSDVRSRGTLTEDDINKAMRAIRLALLEADVNFKVVKSFTGAVKEQALGADIAKVAVMPRAMDDVLTLLQATLQASRTLEIPVVSMAMGGLGTLTRVCGWAFGSAMTFAVGDGISAPGQMPIEDVEAALAVLRRGMGKP